MTYYEELGVLPSATREEIQKAYHRLTKISHPDRYHNTALYREAEARMRRLNAVAKILSDGDLRLKYDERLRHTAQKQLAGFPRRKAAHRSSLLDWHWLNFRRLLPWWLWSTAGALALTGGGTWFWADNLGSSFHPSAAAEWTPAAAPTPAPNILQKISATEPLRAKIQTPPTSPPANEPKPLTYTLTLPVANGVPPGRPTEHAPATPQTKENAEIVWPEAPPLVLSQTASLQLPAVSPVPTPVLPPPALTSLNAAGHWTYVPPRNERSNPNFFPPEYIRLMLRRGAADVLVGSYQARYLVPSHKIKPQVEFQLMATDASGRHFKWWNGVGTRGILTITSLDRNSLRLQWQTTMHAARETLTTGMATLARVDGVD